ncbi:GntR family transcriptional regulator [uncultured Thiothrix sp.]|jgi:DNA-binding GntR family transcriptional regulator|uniref:GntR family transcriptional regulator n=1 Tax=uncultured Thiothrix sp. TaxID=223185 RepID=UPI002608F384|nr:GntR family transcriptional regulator [uncultured Thiothrix sp.]HMT93347.1 GntR family transcriptional regulator [Thiolinea sp.]
MTEMPSTTSEAEQRFQWIYQSLRSRIILLDYEPGTRLSEEQLAKEFKVSRTPIRRVLNRLEVEGLLEIRHGAGNFVTELSMPELLEVFELRMELVRLMDVLAPKAATEGLIQRLHNLQTACLSIANDSNPKRRFAEVNVEVFLSFMDLVGNQALREVQEQLFYRTARMWPYWLDEKNVRHEAEFLHAEISEALRLLANNHYPSFGHLYRCHLAMACQRLATMQTTGV